jgi:hypothetical protein
MLSLGNRLTLPTSSNSAGGLLLDNFGAFVARAYSVRRLSSSYSGYAVNIRKATGNPTADVAFDVNGNISLSSKIYNASNGTADGTPLSTWIGSDNGFVKVWYDQSSLGYNLTQSSNNDYQPKLINGGAILTTNGRPSLDFDGSDDLFPFDESGLNLADISTFCVIKHDVYNAGTKVVWVASFDVNNYYMLLINNGDHLFYYSDDFDVSLNAISNNQFLVTDIAGPILGVATQFQNGVQGNGTNPLDTSNLTDSASNGVMGTAAGNFFCNGHMQELIFYSDDKSPEREAIEREINGYYEIY